MLKLEEAYAEYEKTGARLDETIKFATLMRCVRGQLKTWLQSQVAETQSYSRLREAIVQYNHATTKWSISMVLGQDPDGLALMEIDRVADKGKASPSKGENILIMTILTKDTLTTKKMGFEVDAGMDLAAQAVERRDVELPVGAGRGV